MQEYKLIVIYMEKRILVSCECEGTGLLAVADNGGDGIDTELLAHITNQTGISSESFNRS